MKIGFFDSGIGGLYILESVRVQIPSYDYLYYGDTQHVPYGDKSETEIFMLTRNAMEHMFERGVLLCIVACNTASVASVRALQMYFSVGIFADRKILGVVVPTVERVIELGIKKPFLIGTSRTVTSKKYEYELGKISNEILFASYATPELVPYIESNHRRQAEDYVDEIIDRIRGEYDAIILGCTHYIYLKDHIRSRFNGLVIAQDEIIPEKLILYLERHPEIKNKLSQNGTCEILMTGN